MEVVAAEADQAETAEKEKVLAIKAVSRITRKVILMVEVARITKVRTALGMSQTLLTPRDLRVVVG